MARTAVELHGWHAAPGCRLQRRSSLNQHIDGVARAGSAGTKSGSSARALVLLTMWRPSSRTARLRDQLGLDDEANSQIADGGDMAMRSWAVKWAAQVPMPLIHALTLSGGASRARSFLVLDSAHVSGGVEYRSNASRIHSHEICRHTPPKDAKKES